MGLNQVPKQRSNPKKRSVERRRPISERRLSFEILEDRRLFSGVTADCSRFDVNDDERVTPSDVLQVINVLNSGIGGPENDVTGDGITSPVDVLSIINRINAGVDVCVFNRPPIAKDTVSISPEDAPLTIIPDSADSDGDVLTFGILRQPAHGAVVVNGDGTLTYTPESNFHGSDSFTYRANDGQTDSEEAAVTITVTPINDPTIVKDKSVTLFEDEPAIIDVLADATDADNDFLTPTVAIPPSNGTLVLNPDQTYTYTPNLNFHGTDTFTYEAHDGTGKSSTATVAITVTPLNDAPVATNDTSTTREDEQVIFDVLTNDKDADNDLFAPKVVTSPSMGTLILNADTSFTYTPDANKHGADSFTYTINDGIVDSNVATVAITVTPINDPTIVKDKSVTLLEDKPTIIDVLADATDADNDFLTPTVAIPPSNGTLVLNPDQSFTYTPKTNFYGDDTFTYYASDGTANSNEATVTITVSPVNDPGITPAVTANCVEDMSTIVYPLKNAKDPEGGLLTLTSITQPQNGTADLQSNDAVKYVPNSNYFGPDSFTYTVVDPEGAESTGTITINVLPQKDTLVANNDVAETDQNTPVTIDVLANDLNPDRDRLRVSLPLPGTNGFPNPAKGSVVINPDNTLTFTPKHNWYGTETFEYFVINGSDVSRAKVTIDVKTTHPLFAVDDMAETQEDTPVTIDVLANDSTNADGDRPQVIEAYASYRHGTVTINPDGSLTFSPKLNFHGNALLQYRVSDICTESYGCTHSVGATVTVDVKPVNDAPIAKDDQVTTSVDTPVTVPMLWNDIDVDYDPKQLVSFTQPSHGSVARIEGDVFQNVTYTPNPSFAGNDTFTYTISDGHGGESTATVNITVNNLPKATNITATTPEDTPVDIDVSPYISDLDPADKLSITYNMWAKHGSVIKVSDTVLRYTPSKDYYGDDTFWYTITDGKAVSVATVNMTVTPVNDAPIARNDTVVTPINTPVEIGILGNDYDVDGDPLTMSVATNPMSGTITVGAQGIITYTPIADFKGVDNFTYTITDGKSDPQVGNVQVFVGHFLPLQDPELRTGMDERNADGTLSRADMIALLRSTTDNGAVDSLEINDLQLIVGSQILVMQDYVRELARYILDNNDPANKSYQGKPGEKLTADASSSVFVMHKRIGEHFLGLDRPASPFQYTKAPSRELFVSPLRAEDYPQGITPDCYLVSSVLHSFILSNRSKIIENAFIDNGDGTWTVRFFNKSTINDVDVWRAEYVTVDNWLPTDENGKLVNVGSGISIQSAKLEGPILEKGYAQWAERGHANQPAENSYVAIGGGWPDDAYEHVAGKPAEDYWGLTDERQAELDQALINKWPVNIGTQGNTSYVPYHTYTVLAASNGKYDLINPWGFQHQKGVTYDELKQNVRHITIFDPSNSTSTNTGSGIPSEAISPAEPLYASAALTSPLANKLTDQVLADCDSAGGEDHDISHDVAVTRERTNELVAVDDFFSSLSEEKLSDELILSVFGD